MTVAYLDDLANDLLDAAADALVAATTGHAAPAAVWVNHGEPAADFCCAGGQLTVHLREVTHDPLGTFPGSLAPTLQSCAITPVAHFVVTLLRCHPVPDNQGNPPPSATQGAAAADLLGDLWALLTELYDRAFACTLFQAITTCDDVVIGTAEPASLETQGDCAGWVIPVAVLCNDAGPSGS